MVAFVEGKREPRNAIAVLKVERHKSGRATGCVDFVVEFFQSADRTCHGDHVRAGLRELKRKSGANAARGACDERNTI